MATTLQIVTRLVAGVLTVASAMTAWAGTTLDWKAAAASGAAEARPDDE